jgi:gliding motility-associated-like protein
MQWAMHKEPFNDKKFTKPVDPMLLKCIIYFLFLSAFLLPASGQTDNLFWFAAPDISSDHGDPPKNGAPLRLHITAVHATTVTIERPADPSFTPLTYDLDELEHVSIRLDNIIPINQIECYPNPSVKENKAFKITSNPGEITAYYELDQYWNRDIFPLKGKNALGTDFYVSTQNAFPNGTYANTAWSGFVIAATENNTTITINRNDIWSEYPTAPTPITITLNAGETFAFRSNDRTANRHINGVYVHSDNPIVITQYDDSVGKINGYSTKSPFGPVYSYDVCGDQTIPVTLIGQKYIVMKGQVFDPFKPGFADDGGERIFITSTQPNTDIYVDGVLVHTMVNAGEVYGYPITNNYTLIEGTKPIYIFHTTGYGGELGGAVLPTIDGCTGSRSVTFTRTPNGVDGFFLNVMARNDTSGPNKNKAAQSFTIFSNGVLTPIPENDFDYILDSTWVVLKKDASVQAFYSTKIIAGAEARIENSVSRFHLGVINGGQTTGCKYGYFSDYKSESVGAGIGGAYAIRVYARCNLDPLQLVATGGQAYRWYSIRAGHPEDTVYLSSTRIADPYFSPPFEGDFKFRVIIDLECSPDDTIDLRILTMIGPVAQFDIENNESCSPFKPLFTNHTDMTRAKTLQWNFDTRYSTWVNNNTLTNPFKWPYPENLTDSVQEYTIQLLAKGLSGNCPSISQKKVRILPNVKAGFTSDKNIGCAPLPVHLSDTSLGYLDTLNTYWDLGPYQHTYQQDLDYTFLNNHLEDTLYNVQLIAFSKFGCSDTAEYPVTIHPLIQANFVINDLIGCSPFSTELNPLGSVGVDTFKWAIHDDRFSILDSIFTRNNASSVLFEHNDVTQPNPDTLFVNMVGINDYGCTDTALSKRIIVLPEVHAQFTASDYNICDSIKIEFNNNSIGYNLMHDWNLGDGAFFVDTTENSFVHRYFNRSTSTKDYIVELVSTSDYFCSDTVRDTITVYPFVKANFAIDYSNNCSPLNVEFINISKGGSDFNWNFGDGVFYNTPITESLHHIYENNSDNDTTFYIKLSASNIHGCADSMQRSVFLFPQVVAGFDFDSPNQGCNPLNVSFNNNSRGQNLDFMWDFGDKTYSTSENPPPRTYKNSTDKDTTYYVNLTVMNLAGCDSSVTKTVQVFSKVTADFSIERVDSCSPFKIMVDNFSSGGITDFIWKYTESDSLILYNFSDPVIPVYRNHTLLPVKHPFILKTRNSHGCQASKADTITVFPEMHADFHPDILAGCQPLPVGLTNNSNIIGGTSFFWDFDDGKFSNLSTPPSHIYRNLTNVTDDHFIHLEATTQYGCYDDTTIKVDIYPYIYAKFNLDKPAICADEWFAIDRSSSAGAINHYFWDYQDDGSIDEEKITPVFSYTYPNTGTTNQNHKIRLTVTNAQGCDTSWSETIAVHPQVRASFTMDNQQICYPLPTKFTNLSQPAIPLTYDWNFGDGSSSASKDPSHDYKNFSRTDDKSFTVKLTATSEYGCDSTITSNVIIHPKPLADFNFPHSVDCPPFTVQFTNGSIGTNLDYNWDFKNGNISNDMNPMETFYNTGSVIVQHDVTLIVTTDFNCTDTAFKPVQVYPAVDVDFEASEWNGCSPMQINLDGTATNENEYYWYIDTKVISNYEDPSYRFINESTEDKAYNVRFKAVSINGCTSDTIKQITIYPSPLAEFLPSPQAQDFNTDTDITEVTLNNQTNNQSIWGYYWDYGDGSHSSQSPASFVKGYTIWGDINNENRIPVTLIATNTQHPQCTDTIMHYVIIKPPLPRVELGPDITGCMPLTVTFPSTTKYIYDDSFQWDFGYKDQTSTDNNPGSMIYDTAGMYIVRLSVSGDGGTGWDYKTIQVYPKPIVNFDFDPKYAWLSSQTEAGTPIKFFNNTYDALSFTWEFDDGNESTEKQPKHEYLVAGVYYPKLTAENQYGCWDTLTSEVPVVIEGHGELVFPNAITITPGKPAEEYYDPNDKANRSIFRPLNQGVKKYKLEIYNRWGEVIFESDDVSKGWNGYINGEPAKQDVYVWRVTATFTNGQPFVKAGDLTVLVKQQ